MLSKYHYYCRHCDHGLTFNQNLIFVIENDQKSQGELSISVLPGVYSYSHDMEKPFRKGEKIKFFCPACKKDLQSRKYPKYIELNLFVTNIIKFEILFSPICGEQLTYVIMQGEMEKYEDSFLNLDPEKEKRKAS